MLHGFHVQVIFRSEMVSRVSARSGLSRRTEIQRCESVTLGRPRGIPGATRVTSGDRGPSRTIPRCSQPKSRMWREPQELELQVALQVRQARIEGRGCFLTAEVKLFAEGSRFVGTAPLCLGTFFPFWGYLFMGNSLKSLWWTLKQIPTEWCPTKGPLLQTCTHTGFSIFWGPFSRFSRFRG